MRTRKRTKANIDKVIAMCLGAVLVTVMSGCAEGNMNATNSNKNNIMDDALQTDFSNKATVNLQPMAGGTGSGEATITYNKETKVMSVEVQVAGLEPDSEHAQHIHAGTCDEIGTVIHPLDNLKANGDGEATSTNTIQDVESFDAVNMVLNIHQGPELEGGNAMPIACGTVMASE